MTLQELLNEPERAFLPGPMQELNEDWAEKDALAQEQEERFEKARLWAMKLHGKGRTPKELAHYAVDTAVKWGALLKPCICEQCGKKVGRVVAHHHSYEPEFRISVNWLCDSCHLRIHRARRRAGRE